VLCVGAFGDVGVAFFCLLFLGRDKKSELPPGKPRPEQAKLEPKMLEC
jgi:hypothetical protein